MRKPQTTNQTFSLSSELTVELHIYVKSRERSRFVSDAIRKELESRKNILKHAYLSANEDEGQIEANKDWQSTLGDGLDEW